MPIALGAVALIGAAGGYALFGSRAGSSAATRDSVQPPAVTPTATRPVRDTVRPDTRSAGVDPARAKALLNEWFDGIDTLDGTTLRTLAKPVFDSPGVARADRALAAYLVANAYAKLDDRSGGCEWARRAVSLDAGVRSYGVLVRSLCQP